MWDWVKEHPALTAAGGLGVAVLIYLMSSGSSSSSSASNPGSAIAANNAQTSAQNAQLAGLNIAAGVQQAQIAANQNIAQIQANTINNAIAGNVQTAAIGASSAYSQAELAAQASNFKVAEAANVLNGQTQAQVQMDTINQQAANYRARVTARAAGTMGYNPNASNPYLPLTMRTTAPIGYGAASTLVNSGAGSGATGSYGSSSSSSGGGGVTISV